MQLREEEIRAAVDTVFSDPAFRHGSLMERFAGWLLDLLGALIHQFGSPALPRGVFRVIAAFGAILVVVLFARAALLIRFGHSRNRLRGHRADARDQSAADGWALARASAARGDYTAAAHELYGALLDAVAARGEVDVHESKTIGDYARDLAGRSSASLTRFREFARSYEWIIYGQGTCDRAGYERLHGLAHRVVGSNG